MSKYTQTISSILRENARPGEDVNDLHDICDIAKRCLFDGYGIQAVPSDYRDRLITGFSLHFFNDLSITTTTIRAGISIVREQESLLPRTSF